MASLLERAKQVRDRLKVKAEIEAIPIEERENIYKEIDKAVASNKLRIRENTFNFKPVKSDVKLPVIINLSAFFLIILFAIVFSVYFNQAETYIVSESERILSAESSLIESLREESEQKLSEKENEIQSIQSRLEDIRLEQESVKLKSQAEASKLEAELRLSFEAELESEREKLKNEGFTSDDIEEKIKELENRKEIEYQNRLDLLKFRIEEEQLAKESAINELINTYEQNLQSVRAEQIVIEDSIKEKLEGERDLALNELAELDELKKQEDFALNQILSLYSTINNSIEKSEYEMAMENLTALESYLNQESVSGLQAIDFRKDIDLFMIQSLRRLVAVEMESLEAAIITESVQDEETENVLSTITQMVNEGNILYEQGNLDAARESYLNAISFVPALDSGYSQLQNIAQQNLISERKLFTKNLSEGDLYFNSHEFVSAIEQYRQALEYLENDTDLVSNLVSKLVESGQGLEASKNNFVSEEDLVLLNEAKIQEQSRKILINELSQIEKNITETEFQDSNEEDSTETLYSLLGTKLLIKEVLASDSIQEQYPDLHNKLGLYLDAYGKEKENFGRAMALNEILVITEYLSNQDKSQGMEFSISSTEEDEQRELFLQFLQNLKNLLEMES